MYRPLRLDLNNDSPIRLAINMTTSTYPQGVKSILSSYTIPQEWQEKIAELHKIERDAIRKRSILMEEYNQIISNYIVTEYKRLYPEDFL